MREKLDLKNDRHVYLFVLYFILLIALNVLVYFTFNPVNISGSHAQTPPPETFAPYKIPVLSLRYFPLDPQGASGSAQLIDPLYSGEPSGTTVDSMRTKVTGIRDSVANALEEGSKYHAYSNVSAPASLDYEIYEDKEFLTKIPAVGTNADSFKMLAGNDPNSGISNICDYVENHGVKQVWIWFYPNLSANAPEFDLAPKLGGTFGTNGYKDLSNNKDDLPRCNKTYTVFYYNYGRNAGTAMHDHGHYVEALMGQTGTNFLGTFSNPHGSTTVKNHCGQTHWPPNQSAAEYIYWGTNQVQSDCQNWNPDGTGQSELIDCHTWSGPDCNIETNELKYHTWWMQSIPGLNNNLTYYGTPVGNFWPIVGDFDNFGKPIQATISLASNINGVLTLNGTVSNLPVVTKVEFYRDNNSIPFATDTTAPYSGTFDSNYVINGQHNYHIRVYGSGNAFFNYSRSPDMSVNTLNSDWIPPVLILKSPNFGDVLYDNKVKFDIDLTDNQGISRVVYDIYKSGVTGFSTSHIEVNSAPYNREITIPDGTYDISITAFDLSVNAAQLNIDNFMLIAADNDKDGFPKKIEDFVGTDPNIACGVNAWPPDTNNNKSVDIIDTQQIAAHAGVVGSAKYDKRYNLNGNGSVDVIDLQIAAKIYGQKCTDISVHPNPILTTNKVDCPIPKNTYNVGEVIGGVLMNSTNEIYGVDANYFGTMISSLMSGTHFKVFVHGKLCIQEIDVN